MALTLGSFLELPQLGVVPTHLCGVEERELLPLWQRCNGRIVIGWDQSKELNSTRPADAKISYFVLAATQYGLIGSHGNELLEALAHQCRKNATQKRSSWNSYSSTNRIKGRLSSVVQRAQAIAVRARVPKAGQKTRPRS